MLADYIRQTGSECQVLRNDDPLLAEAQLPSYDALVISPGPGIPATSGKLMEVVQKCHRTKPVLGICLGHQAIGEHFGARLRKAELPRHGKVDPITHTGNPIFAGLPQQFEATRYHSLVIAELPAELEATCTCRGELMGLAHRTLPLWGIQFHPESCRTTYGLKMIENFVELAKPFAST
jgi:anthranilate synthase/aminodeoxychorismate synthase-like glutamine amidotransferase